MNLDMVEQVQTDGGAFEYNFEETGTHQHIYE